LKYWKVKNRNDLIEFNYLNLPNFKCFNGDRISNVCMFKPGNVAVDWQIIQELAGSL